MGKVVTGFSMSLDGFVAGPNDSPQQPLGDGGDRLFRWYSAGDTVLGDPNGPFVIRVSRASAALFQEAMGRAGALVAGRRTFDLSNGWSGRHPLGAPVFVVTHAEHEVPAEWLRQYGGDGTQVRFVTDGFESAMRQAQALAGDKDVVAASPGIAQQCLAVGILDEVSVDLVPCLLLRGIRLFDHIGADPRDLRVTRVVEGTGVTHIRYSVLR